MDTTPSKLQRGVLLPASSTDGNDANPPTSRVRKPPPITPRRFTRFFTPRPQQPTHAVKTSRAALRTLSGTALNIRRNRRPKPVPAQSIKICDGSRGIKRKLSFVLAETSNSSSPVSKLPPLSNSQDLIRSSPTIPERRTPIKDWDNCRDGGDVEDETDINDDLSTDEEGDYDATPKILTYRSKSTAGDSLSSRLTGSKSGKEALTSRLWQEETAHFYSSPADINAEFIRPNAALPFSAASCHTNPLVAIGDEEGRIRLLDTASGTEDGMARAWLTMTPHENALMDLEFSPDDQYLATASGDQSCQIIDVQSQTTLYTLADHRCSVKKVAFQPSSGNQVLASCGRDGQINFWDLRCRNTPRHHVVRRPPAALSMTSNMRSIAPTHMICDAHTASTKTKLNSHRQRANMVPGRSDFSITSLSFLGQSRQHLLVTASELDSTIKLWDIRTSYGASRRAPNPVSIAAAPTSHAHHRSFGITSMALSTDGSRLYSLSRDHTVYAYSTSHLILGSSAQLSSKSKASKPNDTHQGLGPLYGFRHPSMRVQTFWTRLAIRKSTNTHTELLAVGSSDDCAVLFATNERYLTSATKELPFLHNLTNQEPQTLSSNNDRALRSAMLRTSSSSTSFRSRLNGVLDTESSLPIYQHGTPLIRGHDKEVTSLTWSSEGHLVTASDDYTVRCWREAPNEARELRSVGENNGTRWRKGWSDVGLPGFDDEY